MPRQDGPREKRRSRRIEPYLAPCVVAVGRRRLTGYLTNLSSRGARVLCETERLPRAGQAVRVEVRLRPRTPKAELRGQVRWARPASAAQALGAFGVTFRKLDAEEQLAIEWVLSEFRRHAALLA